MKKSIFTIGHSNHQIAAFMELLKAHEISAVADVRSSPYSRYADHFNREILQQSLRCENIAYVFLGNELGAKRVTADCCSDDRVDFEKTARTETFRLGLQRLRLGAQKFNLAVMCAEKDPITCHRMILIARNLDRDEFDIQHILEDGCLETHQDAESRLMLLHGMPLDGGLFQSREDILCEAYRKQGREIAHQLTTEEKEQMWNARH